MSAPKEVPHEDELVDYDEDAAEQTIDAVEKKAAPKAKEVTRGSYVGIQSAGFRDFLLKPELLLAITDCGFEHPSEVQQECIPQAALGMDIICQAKSGMGKTAVFVLAVLQQLPKELPENQVDTLVLCHTRELAYQICQEFLRFSKYLPEVKVKVFFGGIAIEQHRKLLATEVPNVVVGTPGRILALINEKKLKLDHLKRFVMDECDQLLEKLDMRRDVQSIFKQTPHEKQPAEIFVDDESKLTLHGLQQYYVRLTEAQKNRKLNDLLDALEFNQVVIFVNGVRRCQELNKLLVEHNFPSMAIYGGLSQDERLDRYNKFKEYRARILVSTDIFGRGVDFERVNIVFNYDMPTDPDSYLHRVGRSGRFGTKGLAITFVSSAEDSTVLDSVQSRFEVQITELPEEIDVSTYMSA